MAHLELLQQNLVEILHLLRRNNENMEEHLNKLYSIPAKERGDNGKTQVSEGLLRDLEVIVHYLQTETNRYTDLNFRLSDAIHGEQVPVSN